MKMNWWRALWRRIRPTQVKPTTQAKSGKAGVNLDAIREMSNQEPRIVVIDDEDDAW